MSLTLQTVETSATLDAFGVLHVNGPIHGLEPGEVRVFVMASPRSEEAALYDDSDLTPQEWAHGISVLMAPQFADDPAEDIYSLQDGKPYDATQD